MWVLGINLGYVCMASALLTESPPEPSILSLYLHLCPRKDRNTMAIYSLWALSVVVRGTRDQSQALQNLCSPATLLASFNDGRTAELYRISKY